MFVVAIAATIACILSLLLLRWRRKTFSYFKSIGVPGPEPNLLWGNLLEYHRNGLFRALNKWCDQFGDVFGFYNGDVPTLVVKDLEFLQYVFVKNFPNFPNRGITMRTDEMHPFLGKSIIHAKESRWKTMRSCATSGFSAGKLKQMMSHVTEQVDIFMNVLGKIADEGKEEAMLEVFQALTMDFVGRAAFGIDTSFQNDVTHPFLVKAQNVLPGVMTGPFHMIAQCTTAFGDLMRPFFWLNRCLGSFTFDIFAQDTAKVVALRRKDPSLRRNDILQNLLDTEVTEDQPTNGVKLANGNHSTIKGETKKARKLTQEEVVLITTILFLGAFETTATTLSYMCFLLAKHPEIQEKVREEVNEAVESSGRLDYETVTQKLKYMSQVIDETLRLYPPSLTFVTRSAKEAFEFNGIKYKAGTCIMSPVLQIHLDPRYFEDPLKFNPDRFSPENEGTVNRTAYQPFGLGPRSCIGFRMALMEVSYTAARILQKYHIQVGDKQKGVLELDAYGMVSTPGDGPWLKFHRL